LAQRDDALARGIDLIEWTFDPLQLRNAYFNIVRLGVIVRQYLPNVYGRTTSSLDAGLPTDRLVAQWWIREPGVRQVLGNQSLRAPGEVHRIRLPRRIREICSTDPERARQVQLRLSEEFQQHLHDSWAVTGFELDEQYGSYLLEQYED
jgi:predicted GNAT superfamily acetyltransferase